MRPYETILVLSTQLGDKSPELVSKFESVIRDNGGTLDANHSWGVRELAYPIKKEPQGLYYLLEYTAEPDLVKELERQMRITDGVLRFLSVQQDHTGLPEERRRESYDRDSRDRDPRDRDRGDRDSGAGRRPDVPMTELRSTPTAAPAETATTEAKPSVPAPEPDAEVTPATAGAPTDGTKE